LNAEMVNTIFSAYTVNQIVVQAIAPNRSFGANESNNLYDMQEDKSYIMVNFRVIMLKVH